jgi:helix-turn-helix protein
MADFTSIEIMANRKSLTQKPLIIKGEHQQLKSYLQTLRNKALKEEAMLDLG